jgi:hypothetical protein
MKPGRAVNRRVFNKPTDRPRVLTGMFEMWFDPVLCVIDLSLVNKLFLVPLIKVGSNWRVDPKLIENLLEIFCQEETEGGFTLESDR